MNHPILKAATNGGYLCTHTRGRGSIKVKQISQIRENATVIRECSNERKASQREPRNGGQTPQSRHRHQLLLGDWEKTSTKRPHGYLHWQMVWWVKGLMNHPILMVATNVDYYAHTQAGEVV
jgi:hypothetical protein